MIKEILGQVDLSRLSSAIRRLATAASERFGSDCYIHAALAQAILARLGVESTVVAGYAIFRVGPGNSDIIMHAPSPGMIPQPVGITYHAWLEIGDYILDITTYQIPAKCAQLDELDGGTTVATWYPDYLFVPRRSISLMHDVIQLTAGLYRYEQNTEVEAIILRDVLELDEEDIETVWFLYLNQDIKVFGPNSMR